MRRSLLNKLNLSKSLRQALVLFTLLLLPSAAWGQQTFYIIVGGITVNAENPNQEITQDGSGITLGTDGFIRYTTGADGTGTLTLKNATITNFGDKQQALIVSDQINELTIDLQGNNKINTTANNNVMLGNKYPSTDVTFTSTTGTGSLTLENKYATPTASLISNLNTSYQNGLASTSDLSSLATKAEIKPALLIAGVSAYSATIEGTGIVGTITFDAENKILTLEDATIASTTTYAIESSLPNLTIKSKGINKLSSNLNAIHSNSQSATLTIDPYDSTPSSILLLSGESQSAITGFGHFNTGYTSYYIDEKWNQTTGVTWTYTEQSLKISGGSDLQNVIFSSITPCGITIADVRVTNYNASNITGEGINVAEGGEVSYSTGTLTLKNATINGKIRTSIPGLTIDLIGSNTINSDSCAIKTDGLTTLALTIKSSSNPKGTLSLKSTGAGIINDGVTITYSDDLAATPTSLTESTSAIIANDFTGLTIAGTPIFSSNIGENGVISDVSGITGSVSYDASSSTLTLNGATISGNIQSSISPLKVYLKGSSTITPSESDAPFQYIGTGSTATLTFESSEADDGELTLGGVVSENGYGQNITLSSGNYTYSNTFGTGESVTTFGDWIIDYPDSKKHIYYNPHYGITVGNYEVTKKNKGMVTNLSGSDIKYLPEDQALLIPSNSTFANYTIKSHREELTIYVSGDCVSKSIIFESNSNFPATSGVLIIKKDPSSTASINKLTLNNTDGVITGFSNVTIDESLNLLTPATTPTWDATVTEAVFTDETLYDLWVGGERVTSGNKDNVKNEVSADPYFTPSVKFDPSDNILTLNGASIIAAEGKNGIKSKLEELTVNIIGTKTNTISCAGQNDAAIKGTGSNSIIFSGEATSEIDITALNPISDITATYENGLGLTTISGQAHFIEHLKTPGISSSSSEDGISVTLSRPYEDGYDDLNTKYENATMYYSITYASETDNIGVTEYTESFTMAKPGTVTAYLIPGKGRGQSDNATGKYYGYPDAPYTLAVGDEITPAIYPAIDSNDGIEQSGASSGNEDIASFTYSDGVAKAIGIGNTTLTATFTAGDQPFTILNIDPEGQTPNEFTATFSVIVGGSLNEVFEGSNEFGSFYNTSETTYAVPEGMKAYVITGVNGDKVITTETTVLPPNTVVLMDKGEGKAFTYIPATSGSAPTGNLLKRATSDVAVNTSSKLFVLYNDEYVKATAGSPIPAGKNYLDLSGVTAAGTRGFYNIGDGEDGTTAIREVRSGEAGSEKTADGGWHDLQGRRLSAKPTKPGLYILNGKKVVIK